MLTLELAVAREAALTPFDSVAVRCPSRAGSRPRMVLAHRDPQYLSSASRHFRRLGWDVRRASSGAEARRLAFVHEPAVSILDTELADQSGWLSCCKIRRDGRCDKVILISPALERAPIAFARFVGAATLVGEHAGISALVDAVYDAECAAVG